MFNSFIITLCQRTPSPTFMRFILIMKPHPTGRHRKVPTLSQLRLGLALFQKKHRRSGVLNCVQIVF